MGAARIFRSDEAKARLDGWYDRFLAKVPGPVERREVPTVARPEPRPARGRPGEPAAGLLPRLARQLRPPAVRTRAARRPVPADRPGPARPVGEGPAGPDELQGRLARPVGGRGARRAGGGQVRPARGELGRVRRPHDRVGRARPGAASWCCWCPPGW